MSILGDQNILLALVDWKISNYFFNVHKNLGTVKFINTFTFYFTDNLNLFYQIDNYMKFMHLAGKRKFM